MQENKIDKNSLKKMIIVLVSLVLLFSVAFLVFGKDYFNNQAQKEIKNTLEQFSLVKSFEFNFDVKSEFFGKTEEGKALAKDANSRSFFIESSGFVDFSEEENKKINTQTKIKFGDLNQDLIFKLNSSGKEFFLKFDSVPDLGLADLDILKKDWIKIEESFVKDFLKIENTQQEKDLQNLIAKEQARLIKESFLKNKVLEIKQKIEPQEIDGRFFEGYEFTFDKKGLTLFFDDLDEISGGVLYQDSRILDLKNSIKDVDMPSGRVWIDDQNNFFKKMEIVFGSSVNQDLSFNIYTNTYFDKINQKFETQLPTEYILIQDLMKSLNIPLPA